MTSLAGDVACLNVAVASLNGDNATLTGSCPCGWQELNSKCYYISTSDDKYFNFSQAIDFCHEKDAMIFEPRDNHIKDLNVASMEMPLYWIGMVKKLPLVVFDTPQDSGVYYWKWMSDDTFVSVPMSAWYISNDRIIPVHRSCAIVKGKGNKGKPFPAKWYDASCSSSNIGVICEKSVYQN